MPKCDSCGAEFYPEQSGWSACGQCLAEKIEHSLLAEIRLGRRKPMRRVSIVERGESPGQRGRANRSEESRSGLSGLLAGRNQIAGGVSALA